MTKVRVYMAFEEGAAPEPIGACHEKCEAKLPREDDGMELITDGGWWDDKAVQAHPCYVCGE